MSLSRRINSIRRPNAGARIAAVAVGFALFASAAVSIPANADNDGSLPDAPRSRVANDASPSSAADGSSAHPFGADGVPGTRQRGVFGDELRATDDDRLFVVNGTADGVAVLSSRADEDYAWTEFARLDVPVADTDMWLANSCVTSSGDYMAIVYAPRSATNSEAQFKGGASAAIVDLRTGEVSDLGDGFTIAYFNPGCGAHDTVALTRYEPGEALTRVAVIDAADASVVATYAIKGEAYAATSSANGAAFVVSEGKVIRLERERQAQGHRDARTPRVRLDRGRAGAYWICRGRRGRSHCVRHGAKCARQWFGEGGRTRRDSLDRHACGPRREPPRHRGVAPHGSEGGARGGEAFPGRSAGRSFRPRVNSSSTMSRHRAP